MSQQRTAGAWYLVGAGLIVSAVCMSIVAFSSMTSTIEGMQRVVMPGTAKITLPAGTSTLYAEQAAIVDGKSIRVSGPFKFRCGIDEKQRKVHFATASGKVTYSIGDYAGRNAWDVDVAEAGDYTLTCEAEQQFSMAVGRGIGSAIVVAVIGLVPFTIGLLCILVVFFKRRRQRKAASPAT